MAHIHKTITVDAPLDRVYAFAHDPSRWHDWWTNLTEPDSVTGKGEVGTIVKQNYKMAGINFPVTTKVTDLTSTPKEARAKLTFEGPLAGTMEWVYTAKGDDTEVTCDINYNVPGKALGRFADQLIIERLQENQMQHTLDNLKLLCEAEVPVLVAR